MLSIIDRYISKLFWGYFVAGLLVFVTIFLAVDLMSVFARYNASTGALMKYYGYYLPSIVHQMIPVGCLLATVFTLSNLNKSHELTALFSLGTSLARVSLPILMWVSLISVMAFWLSDRILPKFNQKRNYIDYVEIKKKPGLYSTVKKNKIWYRSDNILFNIRTLLPEQKKAQGLTLYYFDSTWKLVQTIRAKDVLLEGQIWRLKSGTVTLFSRESSFPVTKKFSEKLVTMNEGISDLQSSAKTTDVMSGREMKKFIKKNKSAGLETLRYEVDYHSKLGFAFAAFVMSLVGIPFSVGSQRSGGGLKNVSLCIGFAFVYWLFFSSSVTLGRSGLLPPFLAAWLANIVIALAAVYFLVRLKR